MRRAALILTGLLWLASAGVLVSQEVLPALRAREIGLFENLLTQIAPYEESWYGLYHDKELCGGLRVYYEVIDDWHGAKASLKPSLWCDPLTLDGVIDVDKTYRIDQVRWQFRWRDVRGVIYGRCDTKSGTIHWKGKIGAKELSFNTPYQQDAIPLKISLVADAKGIVQKIELPGGFSLRKESADVAMISLKQQNSSAVAAAINLLENQQEQWMKGMHPDQ